MKKLHIGIDIDNVIAESYPAYIDKFNEVFEKQVRFDEVFSFYHLENNAGVDKREVEVFLDTHVHRDDFQIGIQPYGDAVMMVQKWAKSGHILHFITARPVGIREVTKKWLKKHGFWVKGATLDLFDHAKFSLDTLYKIDMVKKYKLDIFIEDNLDIAQILPIQVFLLSRPWNRGKLPKNVIRVKNWEEIDTFVDEFL